MKNLKLLISLFALTLLFSCEKDKSDTSENDSSNKWKLEKIIDRSGNDVTTNCNVNDFLIFLNDEEFTETRFLKKNKECSQSGVFNYVVFENNKKKFFKAKDADTTLGTFEFKDDKLIVIYFDTIITKTTVTYSK